MTVHVAIGNSDDRLTQAQWSRFWASVDQTIRAYASRVYGAWVSSPTAPYQNACWAFEPRWWEGPALQERLAAVGYEFTQETIAWNESDTTMIQCAEAEPPPIAPPLDPEGSGPT